MIAHLILAWQSDLRTVWSDAVNKGFIGGAIAVTQDEIKLFEVESFFPTGPFALTKDSSIPICSVTKLMTADLILGLVTQHKLQLDDAAVRYLPWLPSFAKPITIKQLLTHTSGIRNMELTEGTSPDGTPRIYLSRDVALASTKARLMRVLGAKPAAEPGKKYDYNNADFLFLQAIAESVTGKSFDVLLNDSVFRPAKMSRTAFDPWNGKRDRYVTDYEMDKGRPVMGPNYHFSIYGGSAGVISTPRDVAKWMQFVLKSKSSAINLGSKYGGFQGYGGYAYETKLFGKTEPMFERPGAVGYYEWQVSFLPERGIAVAVFSNQSGVRLGSGFEGKGLAVDLLRAMVANSH